MMRAEQALRLLNPESKTVKANDNVELIDSPVRLAA